MDRSLQKSGISVHELISTAKKKKKCRQRMNCRTFSQISGTGGRSHRNAHCLLTIVSSHLHKPECNLRKHNLQIKQMQQALPVSCGLFQSQKTLCVTWSMCHMSMCHCVYALPCLCVGLILSCVCVSLCLCHMSVSHIYVSLCLCVAVSMCRSDPELSPVSVCHCVCVTCLFVTVSMCCHVYV